MTELVEEAGWENMSDATGTGSVTSFELIFTTNLHVNIVLKLCLNLFSALS